MDETVITISLVAGLIAAGTQHFLQYFAAATGVQIPGGIKRWIIAPLMALAASVIWMSFSEDLAIREPADLFSAFALAIAGSQTAFGYILPKLQSKDFADIAGGDPDPGGA